jgi:hypothetical protein
VLSNCRILSSHINGYEEFCLVGYTALQSVESQLMFQGNILLPSVELKKEPCKNPVSSMKNVTCSCKM